MWDILCEMYYVGCTMWDVLCGICYVVVEYAKWDVLWLNLNWGTTLWALLHLNEESGLEKGVLKFWLRESQEWWWWWRWGWRKWPYPISDRHQWKTLASFPSNRLWLNSYETDPGIEYYDLFECFNLVNNLYSKFIFINRNFCNIWGGRRREIHSCDILTNACDNFDQFMSHLWQIQAKKLTNPCDNFE